jgi:hypothetical protein
MGATRPDWWDYPDRCQAAGHEWGPDRVIVSWHPCSCSVALASAGGNGHLTVRCLEPGCTSTWYKPRHDSGTVRR